MSKTTAVIVEILQDELTVLDNSTVGTPTLLEELAVMEVTINQASNLYKDSMIYPVNDEVLALVRRVGALCIRAGKNYDMPVV
ncbi:hypothetical protein KKH23_07315 [Patescibacteria group bacterium]|nr:hypothetical protein [Patescibacteria group bacterium]